MRFLSMIRIDETTGQQPSERLMTDMMALIGEMSAAGVLLDTAGLLPTAQGARVRSRFGDVRVTDGPFTQAKEVIGGYAILRADSLDDAIAHTRRFLDVHGDEWDIECEVRPIEEPPTDALTAS
ncbi:hypothetical protein FB548_1554 [Pseudoxanthomonas sp. 3HH-4]|uniref:YciI family protein n=1 Tax=Pseudoxanthomonas sp. 3HH-4 TaxID=1690214 RepID=UPI00115174A1|nr:YciI family protein [Pseudoxanthomonas sp. 3HH-4]TQM12707.1 hypothetical protein FB548_1554 [Pseudoxanthomonas sp. 3HH-4]